MWEAWKVSGYLKRSAPATVKSLSQEPAEEISSKSPLPTEEFAIKPAGESSTCRACSRLRLQSPAPGTKPNNTKEKVQWWGGCLSGPRAWVQGTSTEKKKKTKMRDETYNTQYHGTNCWAALEMWGGASSAQGWRTKSCANTERCWLERSLTGYGSCLRFCYLRHGLTM